MSSFSLCKIILCNWICAGNYGENSPVLISYMILSMTSRWVNYVIASTKALHNLSTITDGWEKLAMKIS